MPSEITTSTKVIPSALRPALQSTLRKAVRRFYSCLPRTAKKIFLRRLISLEYDPPSELTFKLAETREELEGAYRILHDSYVAANFMDPHPSGMRVTPYHALPTTSTLIAKWKDQVIGTVSIIRQSAMGLPMEKVFDLSSFRKNGEQVVEISALAIHKHFRGQQGLVLFLLCKFLYDYCLKYFAIDYMAIAVNPKQTDLYEHIMMFDRLKAQTVESYDFVKGAPAVGEILDLKGAHNKLLSEYMDSRAKRNLFTFFMLTKPFRNFKFPNRMYFKASDPVMSPEMLDYFFNKKTNLFSELSNVQKLILKSTYINSPAHLNVVPQSNITKKSFVNRENSRFPVQFSGVLVDLQGNMVCEIQVTQASKIGFLALVRTGIERGDFLTAKIQIGNHDFVQLHVEVIWVQDGQWVGFHIHQFSENWQRLIHYLENDLNRKSSKAIADSCYDKTITKDKYDESA